MSMTPNNKIDAFIDAQPKEEQAKVRKAWNLFSRGFTGEITKADQAKASKKKKRAKIAKQSRKRNR
jgi:hypothetical protein